MEVAVSVIVSNMSVIIPAILRALGVGDPFMQEDTVDPGLNTDVDIARMFPTMVELGLPTSRGTAITDSDESEGGIGTVARQRGSTDLGAKEDHKHQLTTRGLGASLGDLKTTTVVPLADEPKATGSLVRVKSLPTIRRDQSIKVDIEERNPKRNST